MFQSTVLSELTRDEAEAEAEAAATSNRDQAKVAKVYRDPAVDEEKGQASGTTTTDATTPTTPTEVLKRRRRGGKTWKWFGFVFTLLAAGGVAGYLVSTWPESSSRESLPALASSNSSSSSNVTAAGSSDEDALVKVDFSILLDRQAATFDRAAIEGAVSLLRGNIEESLESFEIQSNATTVQYFIQFGNATGSSGGSVGEVVVHQCNSSTAAVTERMRVTVLPSGVVEAGNVTVDTLPDLATHPDPAAAYCLEINDTSGKRRRRLLLLDKASFSLSQMGARLNLNLDAGGERNIYKLEDMLLMTLFESEALHLSLIKDKIIQSVDVSASASSKPLMSGLPLKKNPNQQDGSSSSSPSSPAGGGGGGTNDELYDKYLEEIQGGSDEKNATTPTPTPTPTPTTEEEESDSSSPPPSSPSAGNDTAPAASPGSGNANDSTSTNATTDPPPSLSPTPPSPSPEEADEDSRSMQQCTSRNASSVPYDQTFLDFAEAMHQKTTLKNKLASVQGNESLLLTSALELDWAKPPCALTDHTYYPAVLSFGGVDEFGQVDLSCGRSAYRKYDSRTGLISTVLDTNLVAYFYDDGSLESLWTNETDWVHYTQGDVFYPATHESNLSLWTIYSDEGKVGEVERSLVPRWANAMPCQYYKNFTECVSRSYQKPLKLALVVLHWNDTDPSAIDMDLMRSLYANERIEDYWSGMSYGAMKRMAFETFGPVNINLDEFYDVGEPEEEIKFCVGTKTKEGVMVREGGGCGRRGCTYISPNVISGLYSEFGMATNISCIPGWRPENFFGTVFLTYSSRGCGGAGLFNSVFNIWIDGELKTLRAISMAHKGPHQDCASGTCVFRNHTVGNVEPRYINQTRPEGWEHPLKESNLVQTHELIHLFGIYWHSSARRCDVNATDFRECKHREYGNEFSLVGGAGAALELPAHERYNLHFLNKDDILVLDGDAQGTFQIGPISAALQAKHRAALVVTRDFSLWLEYRRAVGFDTSLAWDDYKSNTEGLLVSHLNHLVDLNPGVPNESQTLFNVTLNAGCSWSPFGTNITIGDVGSKGDLGITFTVTSRNHTNSSDFGYRC